MDLLESAHQLGKYYELHNRYTGQLDIPERHMPNRLKWL